MKDPFDNILSTEGVKGTVLLSAEGRILFERFISNLPQPAEDIDWAPFIGALAGINEADVIFEKLRLYVRRAEVGYLLVFADAFAPMAMVRLQTDLLLPSLKRQSAPRGLMRFFRSRK